MRLLSLPGSGKIALALLGIIAATGAAWGGWILTRPAKPVIDDLASVIDNSAPVVADTPTPPPTPSPSPAPTKPSGKPNHPPIVALRDRMLAQYHGKATNVFTSIPGFGWERMKPMYEKIAFEIPSFSPGEADPLEGKEPPAALVDVFGESLAGFKDPSRPSSSKKLASSSGFPAVDAKGFGIFHREAIAHGVQVRTLDLIGLLDKEAPKVYSGGKAFELIRATKLGKAPKGKDVKPLVVEESPAAKVPEKQPTSETRTLDLFEIAGIAELQKGKEVYIRHNGTVIRMLGALRASDDCLKCHTEKKKDDLLGAFSYTFYSREDLFKSKKKD